MNIVNVDYDGLIPNNVGLNSDTRVKRALEKWHPGYISWWNDMGPEGFQESLVYLRTAVSVDPKGWAKFDYVRMPEYRWGILLAPQVEDRKVPFGAHKGYALAVCAELMGNVVTGSYRFPGPGRGGGTLFITFDPTVFGTAQGYEAAADKVLARVKAVPPAPGFQEVLLPGEPELRNKSKRGAEGVPIPEATWEALKKAGSDLGVNVESV